jgi:NAD+ synthase (glutamine-hydrolysing)
LREYQEIFECLVLGTRDYLRKNGFGQVVIGLSGGIDSALTAVVAVESIGAQNVTLINMPSEISSQHSVDDSRVLAENLGADFQVIPIAGLVDAYSDMLPDILSSSEPNLAYENIQARIRGNILMAMSNKYNWIVLSTGNKSEYATGYTTLYGDMVGGFAVLKDVSKTLVYAIAKDYNQRSGSQVIPAAIIDKEPSAELRPDQFDTDSLPPYEKLDPVLENYIEANAPLEEILRGDLEKSEVERVINLVKSSEYKRWQAPPGVKITELAFGKDRRYPIVNEYHPRDKL